MSPRPNQWRAERHEVFAYAVVACLALGYFRHRLHADFGGLRPFWDARVYAGALKQWRAGQNPYLRPATPSPGDVLPFVSPPVFLHLMGFLSFLFPERVGFPAYCAFASVCALAVPTVLAIFYLRSRWMTPSTALFLTWFQPGKHGSQALLTGNISNVLYAALLAAGVPGLRRNRWIAFYAVLILAGLIKPPFLAFLLLPLLAGRAQWLPSLGALAAVLAGSLGQMVIMPGYWHDFQRSVYLRVVAGGDAGFGLLGQWMRVGRRLPLSLQITPMTGYFLVIVPLLVAIFVLRGRRSGLSAERVWLPCLVLLSVLCNPRILDYDANVAIVPATYLAIEFFLSLPPGPYRGLQVSVPALLFLGLESANAEAALCLLFVASVLMALCQLLWPDYFQRSGATPGGAEAGTPQPGAALTASHQA